MQETHILHDFPEDFYGADLQVCITGFIRDEMKFKSLGTPPMIIITINITSLSLQMN